MSQEDIQHDPSAGPPLEEDLVAYLDGELDAQAERRIEQRLATDPAVRQTLQELEHTWEMLDQLGADEVDVSFTQTTLEMVAVEAEAEVRQVDRDVPRRRRRLLLIQLGGITAAAVVGFLAAVFLKPDPNRQLLEDLPVLEKMDEYRQVGDIEFLRLLRKEGLFVEKEDHGT